MFDGEKLLVHKRRGRWRCSLWWGILGRLKGFKELGIKKNSSELWGSR